MIFLCSFSNSLADLCNRDKKSNRHNLCKSKQKTKKSDPKFLFITQKNATLSDDDLNSVNSPFKLGRLSKECKKK